MLAGGAIVVPSSWPSVKKGAVESSAFGTICVGLALRLDEPPARDDDNSGSRYIRFNTVKLLSPLAVVEGSSVVDGSVVVVVASVCCGRSPFDCDSCKLKRSFEGLKLGGNLGLAVGVTYS